MEGCIRFTRDELILCRKAEQIRHLHENAQPLLRPLMSGRTGHSDKTGHSGEDTLYETPGEFVRDLLRL